MTNVNYWKWSDKKKNFKKFMAFLWMGLNCVKATAISKRHFTFYQLTWLYFYFDNMIKLELVSSLEHWTKNMLEMFVIQHPRIWPNFILIVKRNFHEFNFHYVAMPMMASKTFKSVDFTKTKIQISWEWNIFCSINKIH